MSGRVSGGGAPRRVSAAALGGDVCAGLTPHGLIHVPPPQTPLPYPPHTPLLGGSPITDTGSGSSVPLEKGTGAFPTQTLPLKSREVTLPEGPSPMPQPLC